MKINNDTEISHEWLSVRAANVLRNAGYRTVGEISNLDDREMMRLPFMGVKTLKEVRHFIPCPVRLAQIRQSASNDEAFIDRVAVAILPTIVCDMMADGLYATEDDNAERAAVQAYAYAKAMAEVRG